RRCAYAHFRLCPTRRSSDLVFGCSFERHTGIEHAAHSSGEGLAVRVENREVVQTRRAPRRCGGPTPRPRVEPDVVMVASRREEQDRKSTRLNSSPEWISYAV